MKKILTLGFGMFLIVIGGFYIKQKFEIGKGFKPVLANISADGVSLISDESGLVRVFEGENFVLEGEMTPPLTQINGLVAETDYRLVTEESELRFRTRVESGFKFELSKMIFGKVENEVGEAMVGKVMTLEVGDELRASKTDDRGIYWFELPSSMEGSAKVRLFGSNFVTKVALVGSEIGVPTMTIGSDNNVLGVMAFSIPTISIPTISIPTIAVPSIAMPSIVVPSINVPTIIIPTISVPSISVPSITVPSVIPSIIPGGISMPPIDVNQIVVGPTVDMSQAVSSVVDVSGGDVLVAVSQVTSNVSRAMGIGANGSIYNLLVVTIGDEVEIVGNNFGMADVESVLVNVEGVWRPVVSGEINLEEIRQKFINLESGAVRVISVGRQVLGGDLDVLLAEAGPRLMGIAVSYINSETGLVETVVRMASHLSPEGQEWLGQAASFLISKIEASPYASYFTKYFSWSDRGEDPQAVCANGSCCTGNRTNSNPSGLYPEGTYSPGRDGGYYQCRNGIWVRIDEGEAEPTSSAIDGDKCFCPGGCGASNCYVAKEGYEGFRVDMSCCQQVRQPTRTAVTQRPGITVVPTTRPQQPTSPPVSGKGSCVVSMSGNICGCKNVPLLGVQCGCQNRNESSVLCVNQSECTDANCSSLFWNLMAYPKAATDGVTLNPGDSRINSCTVSFSPGGC